MFQLCSEVNIGSTVDVPEPIFELVWRWSIGTQNVLRFIVGLKRQIFFNYPDFTVQDVLLSLEPVLISSPVCKLTDCEGLR